VAKQRLSMRKIKDILRYRHDAKQSLKNYFEFYNQQRKHQTLKSKPDQVYYESIKLAEAA